MKINKIIILIFLGLAFSGEAVKAQTQKFDIMTFTPPRGCRQNAPGNGSYELKDFSNILRYSDGRISQKSFNFALSQTALTAKMIFIQLYRLNRIK
jgi:hypothetical protein